MREDHLREFISSGHIGDFDSEHSGIFFLRRDMPLTSPRNRLSTVQFVGFFRGYLTR